MLKKIWYTIVIMMLSIVCVLCMEYQNSTFAQDWGEYWTDPISILEKVKEKANNSNQYAVQDTALDATMNKISTKGNNKYRITATLEAVNSKIHVYLQWMMYIGLSIATILLIFNWFMMVTHAAHESGDISVVKKNIMKIGIGVILMTGFWGIIKLILAVVNMFFGLDS